LEAGTYAQCSYREPRIKPACDDREKPLEGGEKSLLQVRQRGRKARMKQGGVRLVVDNVAKTCQQKMSFHCGGPGSITCITLAGRLDILGATPMCMPIYLRIIASGLRGVLLVKYTNSPLLSKAAHVLSTSLGTHNYHRQ